LMCYSPSPDPTSDIDSDPEQVFGETAAERRSRRRATPYSRRAAETAALFAQRAARRAARAQEQAFQELARLLQEAEEEELARLRLTSPTEAETTAANKIQIWAALQLDIYHRAQEERRAQEIFWWPN
jgi:hypothetical protein